MSTHGAAKHHGVGIALLQIFDDTLHNRWRSTTRGGATLVLDANEEHTRLANGEAVPCGQALRASFNESAQELVLQSDEAIATPNASALVLSLAFSFASARACEQQQRATRGSCLAAVCVGVRGHGTRREDTSFVPLCGTSTTGTSTRAGHKWRQAHMPLATLLGISDGFGEVVFVPRTTPNPCAHLELLLDEVWIAAARPLVVGDRPPSYGQGEVEPVRSSWLQGVRQGGAVSKAGPFRGSEHLCEYMTSEVGHAGHRARPRCRMDGDHLEGRWLQTCDPRAIRRPDHFAYGRALPEVRGWYDYRVCYRQSATERLRALQALSWSWRPKSCAFAPIDGAAFDRWLGTRTLLLLGDSLQVATN